MVGEAGEEELRSWSFQANAVSLKLLSFQAWFIRKVTGELELRCHNVLPNPAAR